MLTADPATPAADLPVLVTGAAGLIGSAVCTRLAERGHPVTAMIMAGQTAPSTPTGPPLRVVEGDTCDVGDVAEALTGVRAVVHLAAHRTPDAAAPEVVFGNNVVSTFTVLQQAAQAGVRRAVLASSINASGLPMNHHDVQVAYYPVDELLPIDLDDPYSLSKQTDEHTARMMSRRWGMTTVALRFPLTAEVDRLRDVGRADPGAPATVREGWSYLDVRDAARAVELSLTRPIASAQQILVAAEDVRVPYRTEDLLDAYAPAVPRTRRFVGTEVPMDLTRARTVLGFRAEHTLDLEPTDLP